MTNIVRVVASTRIAMRWSSSSAFSALVTVCAKTSLKYESEYWYIGSTEPKSDTTKYKMEPRVATGR